MRDVAIKRRKTDELYLGVVQNAVLPSKNMWKIPRMKKISKTKKWLKLMKTNDRILINNEE